MIKLDLDDLVSMMSSLESANAYWDGVSLVAAMTESEELAKKELQNEMYLDKIILQYMIIILKLSNHLQILRLEY